MATALDIITRSLRDLGVLGRGEVPDADQAADGLVYLNDLMESLANEKLMIYASTNTATSMTGATSYNFATTTRYISLDSAYFTLNSVDYPVEIITKEQYQDISNKALTGSIPSCVMYDTQFPTGVLYVHPAPSSGTLTVTGRKPFTVFATLTDAVSLPPGYNAMLRANLADAMMSEAGKNKPKITMDARRLKADLKRTNHKPRVMTADINIMNRNSYLIERGY
jgi:hypothetical protein